MRVSLIITTYNWPEALELSLLSTLAQTKLPDEIIIADDGSTFQTAHVIEKFQKEAPITIIHSWQEDDGFRAAMSRNRAIARSSSEYIIMIDGDMVLDPHFIADHLASAQEGYFVQGGRLLLSASRTKRMLQEKDISIRWYDQGVSNRKNGIRSQLLNALFSAQSSSLKGIKTCNFALFRSDALKVNGFDNAFVGWGREDSEFANRLLCAGIKRLNLKFASAAYHLYHMENNRSTLPENDLRLHISISEKRTWCDNGLKLFLNKESL